VNLIEVQGVRACGLEVDPTTKVVSRGSDTSEVVNDMANTGPHFS
jgi:hypothetical protein